MEITEEEKINKSIIKSKKKITKNSDNKIFRFFIIDWIAGSVGGLILILTSHPLE